MTDRGVRKPRIDKKRDVQPTIPLSLKDAIYALSYILNKPVKDICEDACLHGLSSKRVFGELSEYFKRSIALKGTVYIGRLDNPSAERKTILTGRIGIRFKSRDHENLCSLAYALGVTPSRATALLLEASLMDSVFMDAYLQKHLKETINENRMKELKRVIRFLNANNPYDEKISWLALLTYIFREIKDSSISVHDTLVNFMNKWR